MHNPVKRAFSALPIGARIKSNIQSGAACCVRCHAVYLAEIAHECSSETERAERVLVPELGLRGFMRAMSRGRTLPAIC